MLEKGQVAVVTGAAQGIGRSIALALAKRGVNVVCLDVKEQENQQTARLAQDYAAQSDCFTCDVSDCDQVRSCFSQILGRMGHIDILVNNAAVFSTMSFVDSSYEQAMADWHNNMNNNAWSTFLCTKMVAPHMARRGGGQILNLITNHVKRGLYPPSSSEHSYDASKYAQLALNESLDCELKQYGIRVNALCPAATRTPMLQAFFDDLGMELSRETIGQCAGIASLLESDEVGEAACHVLNWDETQPTGKAILLMHSQDCESLKYGCPEQLCRP